MNSEYEQIQTVFKVTSLNWDAIEAVAELLGSVAVVITIIFVAILLRYNSTAVRNSTLQNQTNSSIYQQFQNGVMDENAWIDNLRPLQAPLDTPEGKASWHRQKHTLPDAFQREHGSRRFYLTTPSSAFGQQEKFVHFHFGLKSEQVCKLREALRSF